MQIDEQTKLLAEIKYLREDNKKATKRVDDFKAYFVIALIALGILGCSYYSLGQSLENANETISTLEADIEEVTKERNEFENACFYFDEYVGFLQDELDVYGYWEKLADVEATVSSDGETSFIVYLDGDGDVYHKDGCQYLTESKLKMDIKDVSYYGTPPCSLCYGEEVVPESYTESSSETQPVTVYVTNTGSKYHEDGCQHLSQSKNAISLNDAKAAGYTACSRCH